MCLFSVAAYVSAPAVLPSILNSILNLGNSTYKKKLAYKLEYFVDQDEYFIYLFGHFFTSLFTIGVVMSAICMTFILGVYWVIGAFDAVG